MKICRLRFLTYSVQRYFEFFFKCNGILDLLRVGQYWQRPFWYPKRPLNQFKPAVQQSREQALRAYCPNIHTVIVSTFLQLFTSVDLSCWADFWLTSLLDHLFWLRPGIQACFSKLAIADAAHPSSRASFATAADAAISSSDKSGLAPTDDRKKENWYNRRCWRIGKLARSYVWQRS